MMVEQGVPTDQMVAYHEARARGGVGMIVMESAAVHETGVRGSNVLDTSTDRCIAGYARIAETCAKHGCPVLGQLFHPGREMFFQPDGSRSVAYAPSALPNERHKVMPRALGTDVIREIVKGHGDAAKRFQTAGLAGSEILANMGYLHAQFLNPETNIRIDAYGGSFENRLRFITEPVMTHVRLFGADTDTACFQHTVTGKPVVIDSIDTVVRSMGHMSETALETEVTGWGGEVHVVGDALATADGRRSGAGRDESGLGDMRRSFTGKERAMGLIETLPSEVYLDHMTFESEQEQIFGSTWQYAGISKKSETLAIISSAILSGKASSSCVVKMACCGPSSMFAPTGPAAGWFLKMAASSASHAPITPGHMTLPASSSVPQIRSMSPDLIWKIIS